MSGRPASWRMPTRAQMEKMAAAVGRKAPSARGLAPDDDLPPAYWQALLDDPRADGHRTRAGTSRHLQHLSRIRQHLLRVGCRRCGRTVEIRKVDAVRLYSPDAVWRDVGQHLLDNTCTIRTGRHEEDGCWPSCDTPYSRRSWPRSTIPLRCPEETEKLSPRNWAEPAR